MLVKVLRNTVRANVPYKNNEKRNKDILLKEGDIINVLYIKFEDPRMVIIYEMNSPYEFERTNYIPLEDVDLIKTNKKILKTLKEM